MTGFHYPSTRAVLTGARFHYSRVDGPCQLSLKTDCRDRCDARRFSCSLFTEHRVESEHVQSLMELEEEADVRRPLYTPPVMIRLELHHPDDEGPGLPARCDAEAPGDGDRRTATASDEVTLAEPPRTFDRGCLVPCFPCCHAPVYRAGHVITGHLLVRPLTRLLISG